MSKDKRPIVLCALCGEPALPEDVEPVLRHKGDCCQPKWLSTYQHLMLTEARTTQRWVFACRELLREIRDTLRTIHNLPPRTGGDE